ncbi:unnamed protein product [Amoebophrya sp. A25]|nr:unnamed protein product [Amoebophrya sp. A25]|eukprot:GSA25T00020731001.1
MSIVFGGSSSSSSLVAHAIKSAGIALPLACQARTTSSSPIKTRSGDYNPNPIPSSSPIKARSDEIPTPSIASVFSLGGTKSKSRLVRLAPPRTRMKMLLHQGVLREATSAKRHFAKYRPFIKPIRGPVRLAKAGGPKDQITKQTVIDTGLEDAKVEQERREAEQRALELSEERRVALCGCTPFMSLRYLQAFHATKLPTPASATVTNMSSSQSVDDKTTSTEDIILRLQLDVDLTREAVRGVCVLPNGLQTKIRLLVFCPDRDAQEMKDLGADFAGITDVVKRIQQGWLGFDRCIATQDMMRQVLPVAKILGPKRLMPSPRSGTVVEDLRAAIREVKGGGLLEYRAEGEGELEVAIGNTQFSNAMVLENVKFFITQLMRTRSKGGGGSQGGGQTSGTNLIKDARIERGKSGTSDSGRARSSGASGYILRASLRTASGPDVPLLPSEVLPNSSGYFR